MKRWLGILSQVLLGSSQVYTVMEPAIPVTRKPLICGAIALGQLLVSSIAHSYNPDGTPAKIAYIKDK